MVIKGSIVGIREVNYTNSAGHEVRGRNLYYVFENEFINGNGADSIYLSDSKFRNEIFCIGDEIRVAVGKGYKDFIERC